MLTLLAYACYKCLSRYLPGHILRLPDVMRIYRQLPRLLPDHPQAAADGQELPDLAFHFEHLPSALLTLAQIVHPDMDFANPPSQQALNGILENYEQLSEVSSAVSAAVALCRAVRVRAKLMPADDDDDYTRQAQSSTKDGKLYLAALAYTVRTAEETELLSVSRPGYADLHQAASQFSKSLRALAQQCLADPPQFFKNPPRRACDRLWQDCVTFRFRYATYVKSERAYITFDALYTWMVLSRAKPVLCCGDAQDNQALPGGQARPACQAIASSASHRLKSPQAIAKYYLACSSAAHCFEAIYAESHATAFDLDRTDPALAKQVAASIRARAPTVFLDDGAVPPAVIEVIAQNLSPGRCLQVPADVKLAYDCLLARADHRSSGAFTARDFLALERAHQAEPRTPLALAFACSGAEVWVYLSKTMQLSRDDGCLESFPPGSAEATHSLYFASGTYVLHSALEHLFDVAKDLRRFHVQRQIPKAGGVCADATDYSDFFARLETLSHLRRVQAGTYNLDCLRAYAQRILTYAEYASLVSADTRDRAQSALNAFPSGIPSSDVERVALVAHAVVCAFQDMVCDARESLISRMISATQSLSPLYAKSALGRHYTDLSCGALKSGPHGSSLPASVHRSYSACRDAVVRVYIADPELFMADDWNAIATRTSKHILFRLVTRGPPGHLSLAPGAATDLSPLHPDSFSDPLETAETFLARLGNVAKHTETYRRLQALVSVKRQHAEAKARMDTLNEQARRERERLREQGSVPVLPLAMLQQWQSAENSLRLLETVVQEAQQTVDRATYDELDNPREALPCPRSLADMGDLFWHGYPEVYAAESHYTLLIAKIYRPAQVVAALYRRPGHPNASLLPAAFLESLALSIQLPWSSFRPDKYTHYLGGLALRESLESRVDPFSPRADLALLDLAQACSNIYAPDPANPPRVTLQITAHDSDLVDAAWMALVDTGAPAPVPADSASLDCVLHCLISDLAGPLPFIAALDRDLKLAVHRALAKEASAAVLPASAFSRASELARDAALRNRGETGRYLGALESRLDCQAPPRMSPDPKPRRNTSRPPKQRRDSSSPPKPSAGPEPQQQTEQPQPQTEPQQPEQMTRMPRVSFAEAPQDIDLSDLKLN